MARDFVLPDCSLAYELRCLIGDVDRLLGVYATETPALRALGEWLAGDPSFAPARLRFKPTAREASAAYVREAARRY